LDDQTLGTILSGLINRICNEVGGRWIDDSVYLNKRDWSLLLGISKNHEGKQKKEENEKKY
jgi:hypothetical protein